MRELPDSDAPVTTLLRLENANATDLVPVLTPYLGTQSTAAAFAPTNSLILSGPSSLLRTLRIAIDALDENEAGAPLIWPMRVARAETVAEQLQEIASDLDVPFVSSDPRLNAVLLRVRPGETERIRELVDRLDRPAQAPARHAGGEAALCRPGGARRAARRAAQRHRARPRRPAPRAARGLRGLPFEVAADLPTHSLVPRAGPPSDRRRARRGHRARSPAPRRCS